MILNKNLIVVYRELDWDDDDEDEPEEKQRVKIIQVATEVNRDLVEMLYPSVKNKYTSSHIDSFDDFVDEFGFDAGQDGAYQQSLKTWLDGIGEILYLQSPRTPDDWIDSFEADIENSRSAGEVDV